MSKNPLSEEAETVLKLLSKGIADAKLSLSHVRDSEESKALERLLKDIRKDVEKFFSYFIDRREKQREKTLFEDAIAYFKISNPNDPLQ